MPLSVRLRSMSAALRREAVDMPSAIATPAITQTVMKAGFALLPEFDLVGMDTITSPMFWTRRTGVGIPGLQFLQIRCERGVRFHHRTLFRNRGAETAAERAAFEIFVRFRGGDFFHAT